MTRRKSRTGQTYSATPRLRSYDVPPASEVTVTKADGTTEVVKAQKPKEAQQRRRSSRARGPLICATCGYPIEGQADFSKSYARGKPVHPDGTCPKQEPPKRPTKLPPASTLPRTRGGTGNPYKNPNTRAVGRDQWSKVTCPHCRAVPGQDCTVRTRQGTTEKSAIPHPERIQIVRRALFAQQQAKQQPK
ncbi:zinc finger domain-containing protein [Streptomyces sp. NPDC001635]